MMQKEKNSLGSKFFKVQFKFDLFKPLLAQLYSQSMKISTLSLFTTNTILLNFFKIMFLRVSE